MTSDQYTWVAIYAGFIGIIGVVVLVIVAILASGPQPA